MVGSVAQFYEEVVLTSQVFVIDGKRAFPKCWKMPPECRRAGKLTGFAGLAGEGVDKGEADFAAGAAAVSNASQFCISGDEIAPDFMALCRRSRRRQTINVSC